MKLISVTRHHPHYPHHHQYLNTITTILITVLSVTKPRHQHHHYPHHHHRHHITAAPSSPSPRSLSPSLSRDSLDLSCVVLRLGCDSVAQSRGNDTIQPVRMFSRTHAHTHTDMHTDRRECTHRCTLIYRWIGRFFGLQRTFNTGTLIHSVCLCIYNLSLICFSMYIFSP